MPGGLPDPLPPLGDDIILYYHERNPYYVTTGNQATGLFADRAAEAFEKAGIGYQWRETPAKRQLDQIRWNICRACAVGWFKTAERETFARFTRPIYQDRPMVAITRADNERLMSGRSLDTALAGRTLILLRKDGYSYGAYLDEKIKKHNPRQVITSAGNLSMLKMIQAHRADYFFITEEEARAVLTYSGLPAYEFKYIRFTDMPVGNKRYIMCSNRVESEIMDRLNRAIALLDPEGREQGL